jgi:hypothetical protein
VKSPGICPVFRDCAKNADPCRKDGCLLSIDFLREVDHGKELLRQQGVLLTLPAVGEPDGRQKSSLIWNSTVSYRCHVVSFEDFGSVRIRPILQLFTFHAEELFDPPEETQIQQPTEMIASSSWMRIETACFSNHFLRTHSRRKRDLRGGQPIPTIVRMQ